MVGPRITAWVSYLLHAQFAPEKCLAELMSDLFAVPLSTATIAAMGRRTAQRFEAFLDHVAELIRTAVPVKHLDETGLRIAARSLDELARISQTHRGDLSSGADKRGPWRRLGGVGTV